MAQPVLHGIGDAPDVVGEKAIRSHIEALNREVSTAWMRIDPRSYTLDLTSLGKYSDSILSRTPEGSFMPFIAIWVTSSCISSDMQRTKVSSHTNDWRCCNWTEVLRERALWSIVEYFLFPSGFTSGVGADAAPELGE